MALHVVAHGIWAKVCALAKRALKERMWRLFPSSVRNGGAKADVAEPTCSRAPDSAAFLGRRAEEMDTWRPISIGLSALKKAKVEGVGWTVQQTVASGPREPRVQRMLRQTDWVGVVLDVKVGVELVVSGVGEQCGVAITMKLCFWAEGE
jgi:hypothetical protein